MNKNNIKHFKNKKLNVLLVFTILHIWDLKM